MKLDKINSHTSKTFSLHNSSWFRRNKAIDCDSVSRDKFTSNHWVIVDQFVVQNMDSNGNFRSPFPVKPVFNI